MGKRRDNIRVMAAHNTGNPATHFGRQMKKERLARGWSLRELSARTGINFSHLGRIENGHRPPTEAIAVACDRVFPERGRVGLGGNKGAAGLAQGARIFLVECFVFGDAPNETA